MPVCSSYRVCHWYGKCKWELKRISRPIIWEHNGFSVNYSDTGQSVVDKICADIVQLNSLKLQFICSSSLSCKPTQAGVIVYCQWMNLQAYRHWQRLLKQHCWLDSLTLHLLNEFTNQMKRLQNIYRPLRINIKVHHSNKLNKNCCHGTVNEYEKNPLWTRVFSLLA